MSIEPPIPAKAPSARLRWQFSLGGLLGLVTMICLALVWISSHRTEYALSVPCRGMPSSDDALVAWIGRQDGVSGVRVTRNANVLVVRYNRRDLLPTFDHRMPPLAELGYVQSATRGIAWSARTHSPLLAAHRWLRDRVAFSVVLALTAVCGVAVYARWRIARSRRREKEARRTVPGPIPASDVRGRTTPRT